MPMADFPGSAMASAVPAIIAIGFIVVIVIIIFRVVKGGAEWANNNNSPVLTVDAKVVAKRMQVNQHGHGHGGVHHGTNMMHHHHTTSRYFATFEVDSGDRMELKIPTKEYGLLAEGDVGKLTFQGTRYKGFDRNANPN